MNAARLKAVPRRRPGEVILKELEEEGRRMKEAPPPQRLGESPNHGQGDHALQFDFLILFSSSF